MSEEQGFRFLAGVFILLMIFGLPVAFGFMLGPGAGWLVFAIICGIVAFSFHKLYEQAKAKEVKGNNGNAPTDL